MILYSVPAFWGTLHSAVSQTLTRRSRKRLWQSRAGSNTIQELECRTLLAAVTSVSISGSKVTSGEGILHNLDTVQLTITFDEVVSVDLTNGVPDLRLNNGRIGQYIGGSGTTNLNFRYIINQLDDVPDLEVSALNLNGSEIHGPADVPADLSGATGTASGILRIDTLLPRVVSITRLNSAVAEASASSVSWTVEFTEPVSGVDTLDFVLVHGTELIAPTLLVTPVSESIYTVTADGLAGFGTLGLNLSDNDSIRDSAGNALTIKQSDVLEDLVQSNIVGTSRLAAFVATGDLNLDGHQDLLGAGASDGTVNVLLGNGDGSFQSPLVVGNIQTKWASLSDVNADGKLDLLTLNRSGSSVGVSLGNGDGTFQSLQSFGTEVSPQSISVADLNRDGKPDLIVGNPVPDLEINERDNKISILYGNGDGSFQTHQSLTTNQPPVWPVAIGDLNTDGLLDLVIGYSADVDIYWGDAARTFQERLSIRTAGGGEPGSTIVADVDRDGQLDLVGASGLISVRRGNGDGTFQAVQTSNAGFNVATVESSDIDGDGIQDVIALCTNPAVVSLMLGNGDGTFRIQDAPSVSQGAVTFDVTDFNEDGRPDIVTSTEQSPSAMATVLTNTIRGSVSGQLYVIDRIQPVFSGPSLVQLTENSSTVMTIGASDAHGPVVLAKLDSLDGARFDFDPGSGALTLAAEPDFESPLDANSDNVYEVDISATDTFGNVAVRRVRFEVQNELDGTSGADLFVLTYAGSTVSVSMSVGDGPSIPQGTFSAIQSLELTGLDAADRVMLVGSSQPDQFLVSGSEVKVNGHSVLFNRAAQLTLAGGAGNDTYLLNPNNPLGSIRLDESSAGIDTIDFGAASTSISIHLGRVNLQTINSNLQLQLLSHNTFENVYGGTNDDRITGNQDDNRLWGGSGNDILEGAGGDDVLAGGEGHDIYVFRASTGIESDTLIEAAEDGIDTVSFAALNIPVNFNLGSAAVQEVHAGRTLRLSSRIGFENTLGGSGDDRLFGNGIANRLSGNAGNDRLNGRGGSDLLVGGPGDDNYVFSDATVPEIDTVHEAENGGQDTLRFSAVSDSVTVSLGSRTIQDVHENRRLHLNSSFAFENLAGSPYADHLTGNGAANILIGNAGHDLLNGQSGDDLLIGGAGNDTYQFRQAGAPEADVAVEGLNGGVDMLSFSSISTDVTLSLASGSIQEVHLNRTLRLNSGLRFENAAGGSGDDSLFGNSQPNVLVGNAGDDQLSGFSSRDILIGGLGSDVLDGGANEDILIAGRTSSDANSRNLNSIQLAWMETKTRAMRILDLRTGAGSPEVTLIARGSVRNDSGEADQLTGGFGADWFFRAIDDVIVDLLTGESLDNLSQTQ